MSSQAGISDGYFLKLRIMGTGRKYWIVGMSIVYSQHIQRENPQVDGDNLCNTRCLACLPVQHRDQTDLRVVNNFLRSITKITHARVITAYAGSRCET